VVRGRSGSERDVRPDHSEERGSTNAGELPELLRGTRSSRERVAIGFNAVRADDDDRVWTELRNGVVLGGLAEGDESEIDALWPRDAKVWTFRAARPHVGRALELLLRFGPARAGSEDVGPSSIL